MFGGKNKRSEKADDGLMQKSKRGNMDEYEALRTIIAENSGLLARVLEKIRVQRGLSQKNPKAEAPKSDEKKKKKGKS